MRKVSVARGAVLAVVIAGGISAGAIGVAYAGGGASSPATTSRSTSTVQTGPAPQYVAPQTNSSGQTYGSMLGAMSDAQVPDLVKVVDDQGQIGYARKADILPQWPSSPAEALAQMKARTAATMQKPLPVPVFAPDGKTQIGTFSK